MDRIHKFICVVVPTTACNLRCSYCYLRCYKAKPVGLDCVKYSPAQFRRALSRKRLGGVCLFNFTANGETLLYPQMIEYVRELLEEGHYVEVVTNATIESAFASLASFPKELLSHLMMKCSFHYQQLRERGLLDLFFKNVRMIRDAGASFTVELMPHDEILPFRDEIRNLMIKEVGAPCHLTVGRDAAVSTLPILTHMPIDEYRKAWSLFDSKLFEYKLSVFGRKQTGFCYAGEWMGVVNLATGVMSQCYCGIKSFNIFSSLDKPLPFTAIGAMCREPHCYNAHAWLTFGCIPDSPAPYYDEMRNRVCEDGSEWLKPQVKSFFFPSEIHREQFGVFSEEERIDKD